MEGLDRDETLDIEEESERLHRSFYKLQKAKKLQQLQKQTADNANALGNMPQL